MWAEGLLVAVLAKTPIKQGEVYYIQNTVTKSVKIGKATYQQTPRRLAQLQTGSDAKLVIIKTIPKATRARAFALEAELHRRYAKQHIRGEWHTKEVLPH